MSDYRIVVVGCGHMSRLWVNYILRRSDTQIVALVDIVTEQAEALMQEKNISCPVYTDVKQAIEQTKANLLVDTSIPASHFNNASAAIQLGCHVLTEKPLAENFEQCLNLVKLAEQHQVTHAVMQNRRFDMNIRAVRKMIEEDTIGKLGIVNVDFFLAPHFGGFRETMESPLLLDMAIHTFDQARLITSANPVSVYCHEFNPTGSWYNGHAAAICIMEMSDGSVFNYRGSWCAEGAPTSWEGSWRMVGDKGTIIWDGQVHPYAEVVIPSSTATFLNTFNQVESTPEPQLLGFHESCLEHMFEAIANGTKPETSSDDNIYSMAMVLAAKESAKRQQKVYMSEFI